MKDFTGRRKVVIYMIKDYTGAVDEHIGRCFSGLSYYVVVKIYEGFKRRLKEKTRSRYIG